MTVAAQSLARAHPGRAPIRLEGFLRSATCLILVAIMLLLIVMPLYALLSQSMEDSDNNFVGLQNFVRYIQNPGLVQSIYNSLFVSITVTVITVPLSFIYAYAL